MVAPTFLSRPRLRRLTTLFAAICVSAGAMAIGVAASEEPATAESAPPHAAPSLAASPTATTALPKTRTKSATCTGKARNLTLASGGRTVTEPKVPRPAYLQIKKASVVRDSTGVTISYTLAGDAPDRDSEIPNATYWTWLGDGIGSVDEPSVSMEYLNGEWTVFVNGPATVVGGTVHARLAVHGRTVSVRLPLHVRVSTGWDADLSKFTHAGWSTEGQDPAGRGSWADGCPINGDEAGNPGPWEVPLR
ncbi:hypothetical protein ACFW3D_31930 [Streptomyces sp. NPDC058864]